MFAETGWKSSGLRFPEPDKNGVSCCPESKERAELPDYENGEGA